MAKNESGIIFLWNSPLLSCINLHLSCKVLLIFTSSSQLFAQSLGCLWFAGLWSNRLLWSVALNWFNLSDIVIERCGVIHVYGICDWNQEQEVETKYVQLTKYLDKFLCSARRENHWVVNDWRTMTSRLTVLVLHEELKSQIPVKLRL